jgi:protein-tyrosine phosphatase
MTRLFRRTLNRAVNRLLEAYGSRGRPTRSHLPARPAWRILFVCFGNICRSPLAEGILRSKLEAAELTDLVLVDSAGTSAYNVGRPPDWRARWCARRHGLSIGSLRARQMSVTDFERFDEILVMDRVVLHDVRALAPAEEDRARVMLLMEYARGGDIADPVNGTLADFQRTYEALDIACEALVGRLERTLSQPTGTS